mmetsp:Transcript_5155/g.14425  ORF Transcript_5155/g.14425 Transcript_5155/m.14425 type:complete len:586 (-) Transcript_5155:513-2270(-)
MPLLQGESDCEGEVTPVLSPATRWMRSLFSTIVGWIKGILEFCFIKFYENIVDRAEWDSLVVSWFSWVATKGPLRKPLLDFFATSGNFIHRLTDVRANSKFATPASGPNEPDHLESSLGDVVTSIRDKWGVLYVYCWHGLCGYWGGISMESPGVSHLPVDLVYANPTPGVLEVEPSMGWGPASLAGVGVAKDPAQLYQEMHSYLAGCGVTGVKVDCQAGVGLVPGPGGGPISAYRCHQALEASVTTHFPGNHLINCMGHSTENFYRYTSSAIARACDDFYPSDAASHTSHIGNAAYNSLFLGALVQPDWDMFQSNHPAGLLHAVARAVSGSAVYVSDKPGDHDFSLLRRLVLPDGRVLRPLLPGRPTLDVLFRDPMCDGMSLLKVWNRNAVGGIVGVFNIQGASWDRRRRSFWIHTKNPPTLSAHVCPSDVWGICTGLDGGLQEFVMWRSISRKLQLLESCSGRLFVELKPGGSEAVTIMPVQKVGDVRFAPVGLTELFNPGGAIIAFSLEETQSGSVKAAIQVRALGSFTCFSSRAPAECLLDGERVPFTYDIGNQTLTIESPPPPPPRKDIVKEHRWSVSVCF